MSEKPEKEEQVELLRMNDGTEANGHAIQTETRLFLYIFDMAMADVFAMLNDPEKTKVIKATRYGQTETYRGYKHLCAISEEMNAGSVMISASLKKA